MKSFALFKIFFQEQIFVTNENQKEIYHNKSKAKNLVKIKDEKILACYSTSNKVVPVPIPY